MKDVIEVNNQFYILAGSALADDRTHVLKDADTFGLFDHYGDIHPYGLGEQGLYHDGTRFLSAFDLRINGRRPMFLSSAANAGNDILTINLSNPDLVQDDGSQVRRGALHLSRTRLVIDSGCHERIRIENFGASTIPFTLTLGFDADFADIFEVRGMTRPLRGDVLPPHREGPRTLVFAYQGRDDIRRETRVTIESDQTPLLSERHASLDFTLAPKATATCAVAIRCCRTRGVTGTSSFDAALRSNAARLRDIVRGECRVASNSHALNTSLARCRADLHLMLSPTRYGLYPYAGVPWYSTPFGRDGIITALQTLWFNPDIAHGVLRFLAATQATAFDPANEADPGKIVHEMRGGEMAALGEIPFRQYYGTVDATPLFIVLAGAYYRRTGDRDLIEALWPHIDAALAWCLKSGDADKDGFIEYARRDARGLLHQGWKDSQDSISHADGDLAEPPVALCEVQAYFFAALRAGAALTLALGDHTRSADLSQQARRLREEFDAAFWLADEATYALALDRDKRPCRVRASNVGHCLAAGIVPRERAAAVATTLMSPDSFTGWGIRTLDQREARYNPMSYHNGSVWPHDTSIVAAGLARYGFKQDATQLLTGLLDLSQAMPLRRLPELICGFDREHGEGPTAYPVACAPQAWAAGSLFLALSSCLGLTIDAEYNALTFERPTLPPGVPALSLSGLTVGRTTVDLTLERSGDHVGVRVDRRDGPLDVLVRK
jgi:glycogen debranching enzyme